jgi:hypothetical protein
MLLRTSLRTYNVFLEKNQIHKNNITLKIKVNRKIFK